MVDQKKGFTPHWTITFRAWCAPFIEASTTALLYGYLCLINFQLSNHPRNHKTSVFSRTLQFKCIGLFGLVENSAPAETLTKGVKDQCYKDKVERVAISRWHMSPCDDAAIVENWPRLLLIDDAATLKRVDNIGGLLPCFCCMRFIVSLTPLRVLSESVKPAAAAGKRIIAPAKERKLVLSSATDPLLYGTLSGRWHW